MALFYFSKRAKELSFGNMHDSFSSSDEVLQWIVSHLVLQGNVLRGDASHAKLAQLKEFSKSLMTITEAAFDGVGDSGVQSDDEEQESYCCICYACDADAIFEPCHHKSCYGCITRHLLNSPRCFFCNTAVTEVMRVYSKDWVVAAQWVIFFKVLMLAARTYSRFLEVRQAMDFQAIPFFDAGMEK